MPDDFLPDQLRLFRQRLRWTQEHMASKLGVSQQRYANWERGTARPRREHMALLRQLGAIPTDGEIAEPTPSYGASLGALALMIDILYDSQLPDDIRERTRKELLRQLGIEDDPSLS